MSVDALSKQLEGELLQVGTPPTIERPGVIASGIPELDSLIVRPSGEAVGGFPRGTHWMFAGKPKIGKSLYAAHMMAAAQRQELTVGFVDAERAVATGGADRMAQLGVDPEKVLWIGQKSEGISYILEETLGMIARLADIGVVDVVFIDSVTALVPRSSAAALDDTLGKKLSPEGYLDDKAQAQVARALSQHLRGCAGKCADKGVNLVFIGHQREKPGSGQYVDPSYVPGGYAIQHWCSGIFWVRSRPQSSLLKAEREVADHHHFFRLVLKESRLSPRAGEEIKVALPLDRPLWESELYDQG